MLNHFFFRGKKVLYGTYSNGTKFIHANGWSHWTTARGMPSATNPFFYDPIATLIVSAAYEMFAK